MFLSIRQGVLSQFNKIRNLELELASTNRIINFLTHKQKTELQLTLSYDLEDITMIENATLMELRKYIMFSHSSHLIKQAIIDLKQTIKMLEQGEKLYTIVSKLYTISSDTERQNHITGINKQIRIMKETPINGHEDISDGSVMPYRRVLQKQIWGIEIELSHIETTYDIVCDDCYDPDFLSGLQERLGAHTTIPSSSQVQLSALSS